MTVINEKDYITNFKESGYRSYHLIIKYPINSIAGSKEIHCEIQIRTLAMNFWATSCGCSSSAPLPPNPGWLPPSSANLP